VGWIPVLILPGASFLGRAGETAHAFSFHFDDVRDLPADRFEVLLENGVCPIQGFSVRGRNVRGYQIHPEIGIPAARALMDDTVRTKGQGWALCAQALAGPALDSNLIVRIVDSFLSNSA
jgi:GMP synthase-like glutamine amidotransferase